ncbi:MAG: hypothetical protein ACLRWB_00010 [Gallintestinimicrobium sp.]|uniref:hypothetical protein n=1 Tax=Gallintestinimicrobium sp. TaxID=2981655 RepID=UPI0039A163AB
MGQKYSGTNINTITGFEIAAKKPIDPRMQVDTKADLEKIQYQWVGMTVFVEDEGEDYQLKTSGWVKKSTQGPKGDKGETGAVGPKGADGKSAYEVWVAQPGNAGKNEQEYLASLKGDKGETGAAGAKGDRGETGAAGAKGDKGETGAVGPKGADGKSAYEVWVAQPGNAGKNEQEYLASLKGDKGETGAAGAKGDRGETGAVGPQGAEGAQGPAGQKGEKGDPFSIAKVYKSVAEMNSGYAADGVPQGGFVVINTGNVEDEDNAKLFYKGTAKYEYLTDLSGAQGMTGPKGETGATGKQGPVGPQGETGAKGDKGEKGEPGDNVRVGTEYDTAKQTKLFFKIVN